MSTQSLVLESSGTKRARHEGSSVKSVLVHVQDSDSAIDLLEAGLSVARAASAHLTCLQVTAIEGYVAFDGVGGVFIMDDVMKAIDKEAERLRKRVDEELRSEDVSWDHIQVTGSVATQIVRHSALADLAVVGREPRRNRLGSPSITLLGDLLQTSRTPLLIPGTSAVDPNGAAVVAWNGSFEAANAVRSSVGLLKLASSVTVLHVTGAQPRSDAFPGTRLLEYLSRHGIHAELIVESLFNPDDDLIAAALVEHARSRRAYIVMGGYGHGRLREFLFGGVTRTMLSDSEVPLVMAG